MNSPWKAGKRATVQGFAHNISKGYRHRLMAIGLLPGTPVQVIRLAPLGDPMALQVRDTAIVLRRDEVKAIHWSFDP